MKTLVIGKGEAGRTVTELLRAHFRLPWKEIRGLLQARRVRLGGTPCPDPNRRARLGQRLEVLPDLALPKNPASRKRKSAVMPTKASASFSKSPKKTSQHPEIFIVFADPHIVVVNKPAGLTTVRHAHETAEFGERGRRFLPPTLVDLLPALLAKKPGARPERVRAVHRLDKETSGLVVLARTSQAERHLGGQFRAHTTERRYLALVRGRARQERIESFLVPDRGDGRRGSSPQAGQGQRAVTHVRLVEELGDFSFVECRLETGRTHQVRIHLGERGTPLCGEQVYNRPVKGQPLPDSSGANRPALHAAYLTFDHPLTGKRLAWTAALPKDMQQLLEWLRRSQSGLS